MVAQKRRVLVNDEYVEPSDMSLLVWREKRESAYKEGMVSNAPLDSYRYALARLLHTLVYMQLGKRDYSHRHSDGLTASQRVS